MKQSEYQTHYDVLGISATAGPEQIQAAYSELLSIYDTDSLSTYSLFSESERQAILDRSRTAYKVLMDTGKREEYDQCLADGGHGSTPGEKKKDPVQPKPMFSRQNEQTIRQMKKNIHQKHVEKDIRTLREEMQAKSALSGADLKLVRTSIDLTLEEIFAVTRIPVPVLRAIEEDVVVKLPSPVFLKGYIKQYAECLGLDPTVILAAYLNHLKQIS